MPLKRKICVVTGTRAEFGLLYWLLQEIRNDPEMELQILATGMHLSPEFGLTYREIEAEGFPIHRRIEILLSSDTPVGISKSIGLAVMGFAEAYEELRPDIVVLLGDRFETLAAAVAAAVARIAVAHLHGGESTEGAMDEAFRHAITKMAHFHFTSTEAYRRRVIRLGEAPDRVFQVGALGMDNIRRLKLLERAAFEQSIGFPLGPRNLLVTFHPETLAGGTAAGAFQHLLDALGELEDARVIFTKPNADTGGRVIMEMIDRHVAEHPGRAAAFTSLGRLRYLSAMQFVDAVVGNSSSGILEAPSFRIGTINIGDRQRGRIRAESVIDCEPTLSSIREALLRLYSPGFQARLREVENPYGSGGAAEAVHGVLKRVSLENVLKKEFYDSGGQP